MQKEKIKFYKNKHFYINIVIGLSIAIASHFIENTRLGIKTLDYIFDLYIANESDKAQENVHLEETYKNFSKDIVIVDIKYANYKQWEFPLVTPRDVLAKIISLADSSGAKIIIPDFFFDYHDYKTPEKDDSLRHVLTQIANRNNTKIIFPNTIGIDGRLKPNIFNDLIENNEKFYYALPTVVASSHDGVVRYAEDYDFYIKSIENKDSIYSKILSVPLMVSKLINNANSNKKELGVEGSVEKGNNTTKILTEISEKKEAENYLYNKRIRFLIVPGREDDNAVRTGNIPVEQYFQIDNIIPQYLKGKIILIGTSNPESTDNHVTPIGTIPGMYILGNAINTEIMHLNPKEVSLFIKLSVEFIVIIIASFLFLLFHELVAQIIASAIILIVLGSINYYIFYNYGVFINFILPVLVMGFHRIISEFELIISSGISKNH